MNLLTYLDYLNELQSDQKPHWGSLTAQHMVEHLTYVFRVSMGKVHSTVKVEEEQINTYKEHLTNDQPLPKNQEAFLRRERYPTLWRLNLKQSIADLKRELNSYQGYYKLLPDRKHNHPLFGALNKNEWDTFHHKHFRHHLKQFGLI